MMKRLNRFLSAALCLLMLSLCVTAVSAEQLPLLIDEAELLTDEEYDEVDAALARVSEKAGCDVACAYIAEIQDNTTLEFAEWLYDYAEWREDGFLFMIAMDVREWILIARGSCEERLTDETRLRIEDAIDAGLAEEGFGPAALAYAEAVDAFLTSPAPVRSDTPLTGRPRLVDDADLLTESEESSLMARLDALSDRWDFDVTVATVSSLGGRDIVNFADDWYDESSWRTDGILFLVDMGNREWAFSTAGIGIGIFGDDDLDYMEDRIIPYLSSGDYDGAFDEYADLVEQLVSYAKTYGHDLSIDGYYSDNSVPYPFESEKGRMNPVTKGVLCAGAGALLALIVTGSMKSKMKTVRMAGDASGYVRRDSMYLTQSNDQFLYKNVTRTLRQSSSSGSSHHGGGSYHSSSSGASHGGSHGHF